MPHHHDSEPPHHRPGRGLFARPLTTLGIFVLFAGMLFWTKLRLVSEIPRTAYAVPKETATPDTPDAETDPQTDPETDPESGSADDPAASDHDAPGDPDHD